MSLSFETETSTIYNYGGEQGEAGVLEGWEGGGGEVDGEVYGDFFFSYRLVGVLEGRCLLI